jgi:prophage regulatory protein
MDTKTNNLKILRLAAVKECTGLSRSTIYLMINKGEFPKNVRIGAKAVGWVDSDLQSWIESRIARDKAAES